MRAPTTLPRLLPLIAALLLPVSFPMNVRASWTEGEATILDLNEILPRANAVLGTPIDTDLPAETPILLPYGGDLDDAKTLQVALLQSGLSLKQQGGRVLIQDAGAASELSRARMRLRPIAPLAPRATDADRIQTGGVVLFGEILAPPYKVEVAGDAVEINGVAVYPVQGPDVTPPEPTAAQRETHDRMDAAVAAYPGNVGALGSTEAKRILADELKRLPDFTNATWINDTEIRLTRKDGISEILTLQAEARDADPPTAEAQREALETEARILAKALREDATIFCGATYLLTTTAPAASSLRSRLNQILDSAETAALKIARLQVYTGHRDAAADLLYARAR